MDCTLLGGTSTDFNVMTRRGTRRAGVQVLHESASLPATDQGLLLAVRGSWQVHGPAHADTRTDSRTDAVTLAEGEGVWWHGTPHAWHLQPADSGAQLLWVPLAG